jgi:hypothetical protein
MQIKITNTVGLVNFYIRKAPKVRSRVQMKSQINPVILVAIKSQV